MRSRTAGRESTVSPEMPEHAIQRIIRTPSPMTRFLGQAQQTRDFSQRLHLDNQISGKIRALNGDAVIKCRAVVPA